MQFLIDNWIRTTIFFRSFSLFLSFRYQFNLRCICVYLDEFVCCACNVHACNRYKLPSPSLPLSTKLKYKKQPAAVTQTHTQSVNSRIFHSFCSVRSWESVHRNRNYIIGIFSTITNTIGMKRAMGKRLMQETLDHLYRNRAFFC